MTPLADRATEYAADRALSQAEYGRLQRAFMAGALAALTTKETPEALLKQCVQFGRAIGTTAEVAR